MEQTAKASRPKRALAGKSEEQLLHAYYKSCKRANVVMEGMPAGLSDQDMANFGCLLRVTQVKVMLGARSGPTMVRSRDAGCGGCCGPRRATVKETNHGRATTAPPA